MVLSDVHERFIRGLSGNRKIVFASSEDAFAAERPMMSWDIMESEKDNLQTRMPTRPFIPPRDFRAVLRRVVSLTPSTKHFEWEAIEGGAFEFYAGQFVSLEVPRNGEPEARPYSIASAPRGDSRFDLCLNRVEGGFVSNYLCDLEANAIVNMKGPHGSFVVSQPVEQDLVFIATGTGIALRRGGD